MTDSPVPTRAPRIVLSALLVAAALVIGYIAGRSTPDSPALQASTTPTPRNAAPVQKADDTAEMKEQLAAVGYTGGSIKAPAKSGITKDAGAAAYRSYNFFTSGHIPGAELMSMDGRVLHQWQMSFQQLWPGKSPGEDDVSFWRRARLSDNGDVIAIIEPIGIFKLDRDSKVLWKNDCGAHHDFFVRDDGHIFTLARKPRLTDVVGVQRTILEDFVVELAPDGRELRRGSIFDALNTSEYRPLLYGAPNHWDITHANSLKLVGSGFEGTFHPMQPGRLLISIRELDSVAALDFDRGRVEWAMKGLWRGQHEATLLSNGHLLVFDNLAGNQQSRVIEVEPATHEIVWRYGAKPDQPLYSRYCGLAERLPNGNTLITESLPGRVLEVAPDGTIVWEFVNPNRAKKDPSCIASIFDFQRFPQTFAPSWIEPAGGKA